jgi:hypothetical protein
MTSFVDVCCGPQPIAARGPQRAAHEAFGGDTLRGVSRPGVARHLARALACSADRGKRTQIDRPIRMAGRVPAATAS